MRFPSSLVYPKIAWDNPMSPPSPQYTPILCKRLTWWCRGDLYCSYACHRLAPGGQPGGLWNAWSKVDNFTEGWGHFVIWSSLVRFSTAENPSSYIPHIPHLLTFLSSDSKPCSRPGCVHSLQAIHVIFLRLLSLIQKSVANSPTPNYRFCNSGKIACITPLPRGGKEPIRSLAFPHMSPLLGRGGGRVKPMTCGSDMCIYTEYV